MEEHDTDAKLQVPVIPSDHALIHSLGSALHAAQHDRACGCDICPIITKSLTWYEVWSEKQRMSEVRNA